MVSLPQRSQVLCATCSSIEAEQTSNWASIDGRQCAVELTCFHALWLAPARMTIGFVRTRRDCGATEPARKIARDGAPVLSGYLQGSAGADIVRVAGERGDVGHYPMWAGQGVGMIRDIPSAADIVAALVREANEARRRHL